MELPNLEGQPGWVVVLVVAFIVTGTLGGLWLKNRKAHQEPQQTQLPEPITGTIITDSNFTALAVIQAAMEHLAETARREAEQGERAEGEARALRSQLEQVSRELADHKRRLDECEKHARDLAKLAYNPRRES